MSNKSSQANRAISEIELVYKPLHLVNCSPKIIDCKSAYQLFLETWDTSKLEFVEQFKVLLLNRANRVLGICTLSTGGTNSTIIDFKCLFVVAIKSNASAIIIAHNHPSGELTPSKLDIEMTKRIYDAGKILDIALLDHLIITKQSYYSLKNEGAFNSFLFWKR